MMRVSIFFSALLSIVFALASSAFADERILNYDVHIRVADDGELHVRERILARAERRQMKHGIYRDFPLLFQDDDGVHRVGFKLGRALRDGKKEKVQTSRSEQFVRIRLGDAEVMLDRRDYLWEINYRTDRQLRFFETHDELNWNATGTEWVFPIDAVRVTIELPDGVTVSETKGFTGGFGAKEQNVRLVSHEGQTLVFESTEPLGRREGVTVIVMAEKGGFAAPTDGQRRAWWMRDHRAFMFSLAALLFALLCYGYGRFRHGRDPKPGVIVPRWDLPPGASALRVSTLDRRRLPKEVDLLSLSLVELASQGIVEFQTEGKVTTLIPQQAEPRPLPPELRELAEALVEQADPIEINAANSDWFEARHDAVKTPLAHWFDTADIFVQHYGFVILSVLGSVALFAMGMTQEPEDVVLTLVFTLAVFASLMFWTPETLRGLRVTGGIIVWVPPLFHVLIATLLLIAMFAHLGESSIGIIVPAIGVILLTLHRLFVPVRRHATTQGRKMLDEVEGLRRYIALAEADRMNLPGRPEMSVLHYERLLPYAMALGLERPWTKQFKIWLDKVGFQPSSGLAAHVTTSGYGSGLVGSGFGGVSFQQALSKSLTASLPIAVAASSMSSSSGGGGGGSSGGGGGGGGGGGW